MLATVYFYHCLQPLPHSSLFTLKLVPSSSSNNSLTHPHLLPNRYSSRSKTLLLSLQLIQSPFPHSIFYSLNIWKNGFVISCRKARRKSKLLSTLICLCKRTEKRSVILEEHFCVSFPLLAYKPHVSNEVVSSQLNPNSARPELKSAFSLSSLSPLLGL